MSITVAAWRWPVDVVTVVCGLAGLYLVGWWRLRRSRVASRWRLLAHLAGLTVVVFALLSPLASWAALSFTLHMVQHELLGMVAAPLLLLAKPFPVLLWGLPTAVREAAGRLLAPGRALRSGLRAATWAPTAWMLHFGVTGLWHWPSLYERALSSSRLHDVQHVSMFLTAILFWVPLVAPAPRLRTPLPGGLRILYVGASMLPHMLVVMPVAVLLEAPLYPSYAAGPQLWGLTVVQDQQTGLVLMGFWESLTYAAILPALVRVMLGRDDEDAPTEAGASQPPVAGRST